MTSLDPVIVQTLDDIAPHLLIVEAWVNAVKDQLTRWLEEGVKLKHAELTPTRPSRAWGDEARALEFLSEYASLDIVCPRKIISPAQAEKVLGLAKARSGGLSQFVVSESKGTKLKILATP